MRNHAGGHPFVVAAAEHEADALAFFGPFVAEYEGRLRKIHPRFDGLHFDVAGLFFVAPAHHFADIGFAVHQLVEAFGLFALFVQRFLLFRAAVLQAGGGGVFGTVEQPVAAEGVGVQDAAQHVAGFGRQIGGGEHVAHQKHARGVGFGEHVGHAGAFFFVPNPHRHIHDAAFAPALFLLGAFVFVIVNR